ncbi:hypothetical protein [Sphingomonas faeni]|uniref:hypothetical protein n=1 Tax=Sphingomonas faeni TaxID=185950 RepID=UPI0020C16DD8|nr:hypothetical protein [Sphingomonas faeni]MCK8457039.1 hypothetical protein [Sphingomonas faeni]
MSADRKDSWKSYLGVFAEQAGNLPEGWADTFWIAALVDLAKTLNAAQSVLTDEQKSALVAVGACIVRQLEKEAEARDLAATMIARARGGTA